MSPNPVRAGEATCRSVLSNQAVEANRGEPSSFGVSDEH